MLVSTAISRLPSASVMRIFVLTVSQSLQIDCEMSFVDQDDVINLFEEMARHLFKEIRGVELPKLEQMTWHDAMRRFGSDKPDLRFGMEFVELKDAFTGKGNFSVLMRLSILAVSVFLVVLIIAVSS